MQNLFADIPVDLPDECFETLVKTGAVHIERIVSRGHASPDDAWYDQDRSEWVLLAQGAAGVRRWFPGVEPPLEIMRAAVQRALG